MAAEVGENAKPGREHARRDWSGDDHPRSRKMEEQRGDFTTVELHCIYSQPAIRGTCMETIQTAEKHALTLLDKELFLVLVYVNK